MKSRPASLNGKPDHGQKKPAKSREDVLADFRKIAGPLRGQNRDRKPKS